MNNPKISTNLAEFNYFLPQELIAQEPIRPRDHSRLMVLNRKNHTITHDSFYNLDKYLKQNDILVANNSKVIPARLFGKKTSGGKMEILLLKPIDNNWEVMLKGKGRLNMKIIFNKKLFGILKEQTSDQIWKIEFNLKDDSLIKQINKLGHTPTPPYIKRISNLKEYQTIYAQKSGSVAAPTAGFHFTKKNIKRLKKQMIDFEFITLHVGLGTFQPVRTENIEEHQIHTEWGEIEKQTAEKLNQAKKNRQRIIAIGTTTTRILETFTTNNKLKPQKKWINTFIYPGYKFKFIDGLITNFHLPESSLLILVSAFAEKEFIQKAYKQAIQRKYRFYSFGDAMLIT